MFWRFKKKQSYNGFTLLEIIIVIIIIGVLASLALPKLFGLIERARAAEAFAKMSSLRSSIERCLLLHDDDADTCCKGFDHLDYNPSTVNPFAQHFFYQFDNYNGTPGYSYEVTAIRTPLNGGQMGSDIVFRYYPLGAGPGGRDGLLYVGHGDFTGITNCPSCF